MKILQVMAGASEGGAETAFVDFCIAQKQSGHDVIVATRPNPIRVPALQKAGIQVFQYPFGGKVDMYTTMALRQMIKREKPQIIQTWMSRAAQKLPSWYGDVTSKPYRVISRLGNYYKIKNFANTDYFTTITPLIREYLIDEGVHPDTVRHINNFAETEGDVEALPRATYDTPDDVPLLLSLSRLHDAKAIDILLKALVNIPDAYLWIAGDGPLKEELIELSTELQINDRVKFLGWRTDRAALMGAANILVFPSRYEPFGTTFVQAWSHNIPLVTSDADGPRQFVRDGEDGLVVPRDDVQALQHAIRKVIDQPELATYLAKNGFVRYREEFTTEKCLAAYDDFYQHILRMNETDTATKHSAPA